MKLYLLTRNNEIYQDEDDEYIGAVIAADSPEEAIEIMLELENHDWKCSLISQSIEPEIQKGVVLDSYNAG